MARLWYGGTPADFVVGQGATTNILDDDGDSTGDQMRYLGLPLESTDFDVYQDDMSTVETDLLNSSGTPIEHVTSLTIYEERGRIPAFQGADGYERDYYLSADGVTFYRMSPSTSELYARVGDAEAALSDLSTLALADWSDDAPGHGDVAKWDESQGRWTPSTTESTLSSIDDLDDVETEGMSLGQVLAMDNDGVLRPAVRATHTTDLQDWSDDSPTDGYVPVWDGDEGEYVPTDLGEFTTGVGSVNGQTGTVNLDASDVGAAESSHTHAASDITSGVIGVSRLPVGVGFNQVAAGDHTHNASAITAGTMSVNRLPVGTTSSTVAAGNHTHPRDYVVGITPGMGSAWGDQNNVYYIKCGIVFVQVDAVRTGSGFTGNDVGFGTLPSGVRPPRGWYGTVQNRANGSSYALEIESDGDIVGRNMVVSTGHAVRGHIVFPLAN